MADVYGSAETYTDRGTVAGGWPDPSPQNFVTHFQRPDRYRFVYPTGLVRSFTFEAARFCLGSAWIANLLMRRDHPDVGSSKLESDERFVRIVSTVRSSERTLWLDPETLLVRKYLLDFGRGYRRWKKEFAEREARLRALPTVPRELHDRCRPREEWGEHRLEVTFEPAINVPVDPTWFA